MKNKKFINIARDVINLEIKALQILKKNINKSFNEAVNSISKCQSKVILCGVGKSGLIASKIASAANGGGTKTQDTFAPASTASLTVSHIGKPNVSCPPFPGVTPPTSLVP